MISTQLGESFESAFQNLIPIFCIYLPITDEFLEKLVNARSITDSERYQIFSTPRPTVYSNIQRGLRLLQILRISWRYVSFVAVLRSLVSENLRDINYFLCSMETEFSNWQEISSYFNNLSSANE